MVLPSSDISQNSGKVNCKKDPSLSKLKASRNNFAKAKARKLSRKRRRARRKRERSSTEVKDMTYKKGPYDFYWSNYLQCLKWMQNHNVSFWKSRVQALEYENGMLRSLLGDGSAQKSENKVPLHNLYCKRFEGIGKNVVHTSGWNANNEGNEAEFAYADSDDDIEGNAGEYADICSGEKVEDNNDSDIEFEVDDNMIEFFTQSMKHKLALQRERDENDSDTEHKCISSNDSELNSKRKKKCGTSSGQSRRGGESVCKLGQKEQNMFPMELSKQTDSIETSNLEDILQKKSEREEKERQKYDLYGNCTPKILGMETAVQLNFRQSCTSRHPTVWPIIPLNLQYYD